MIDKLELETKTEQLADGTYVVSVAGELDMHTTPAFERELHGALDDGPEALIVDLSACEFFDSTALGVLIGVRKAVADSARALALVAPDAGIRRVFELTGCDELFSLHATRVAAMNGGVHHG